MALRPPVENGLRESEEIKEGLTLIVGASLFYYSIRSLLSTHGCSPEYWVIRERNVAENASLFCVIFREFLPRFLGVLGLFRNEFHALFPREIFEKKEGNALNG